MLKFQYLFASSTVRIYQVECSAGRGAYGELETAAASMVVLPSSGAFAYHFSPRDSSIADANTAVVLRAGEAFKISHPHHGGDRCTVVEFADDDALGALQGVRSLDARAALLAHAAISGATNAASALEIQECAVALRDALDSLEPRVRHTTVELAKAALSRDPFDDRSLDDIAREVGASPFHLTRMFKKATGLSLHAYRMHLRLRRGLERVRGGDSLADVAVDCGFAHHSQFTAAFRRHFGSTPSQLRKISTAR
jgi:AraC family transcriptional regulator